jgi:hypothetical protein
MIQIFNVKCQINDKFLNVQNSEQNIWSFEIWTSFELYSPSAHHFVQALTLYSCPTPLLIF